MNPSVTPETLRRLGEFDTCTLANAIESFGVRLRNEGFSDSTLACRTPRIPVMVGQAVTLRVRSSDPPMGDVFYLDQPDWWERLDIEPSEHPRVLVIEDIDHHPGRGALVGALHACILRALGCVGVVTNGAVRHLEKFEEIGLQAFSGGVSPSHAYGHVVAVGVPVEVAGLRIKPGEILHGDRHGVVSVPSDLAARLPDAARQFLDRETKICQFCASADFSTSALRRFIETDSGRI
jgi:4-hydroxy-4-methyl-2-oxoglutarate aldolase